MDWAQAEGINEGKVWLSYLCDACVGRIVQLQLEKKLLDKGNLQLCR